MLTQLIYTGVKLEPQIGNKRNNSTEEILASSSVYNIPRALILISFQERNHPETIRSSYKVNGAGEHDTTPA